MSKSDLPPERAAAAARCPICGGERSAQYRPFCSKRCADVDLNRWLVGVYAVPAQPAADEGEGEPDPQAASEEQ